MNSILAFILSLLSRSLSFFFSFPLIYFLHWVNTVHLIHSSYIKCAKCNTVKYTTKDGIDSVGKTKTKSVANRHTVKQCILHMHIAHIAHSSISQPSKIVSIFTSILFTCHFDWNCIRKAKYDCEFGSNIKQN